MRQTVRIIRRESLGPREADEPHRVLPRQPPPPAPLDAYQLVRAITTARLLRDWPTADKLLAALERLAERHPRTEGEHDDADE